MTAVLGVTYPKGVILASDSFRIGGQQKIFDAQKVFQGPNLVLGASGTTSYVSKAFDEILHLHKILISAIFTNNATKTSIEETNLVAYYRDYMRLLHHLAPNKQETEVLIGFPSSTSTLITLFGGAENPQCTSSNTYAAIGNARAYVDFLTAPNAVPAAILARLRALPAPPPLKTAFQSRQEAEVWLGGAIEWICRGFPDSCGGKIQFESLEAP